MQPACRLRPFAARYAGASAARALGSPIFADIGGEE